MIEEPKEISTEDEENLPPDGMEEISGSAAPSAEDLSEPRFLQRFSYKLVALSFLSRVADFFRWVGGGNVRISVAAGILAGFITALGFLLFDLRRDEWELKQKYPEAVSSYERRLLHANDLVGLKRYTDAEPILRNLAERRSGAGMHADTLFLLGKCLARSAVDRASAMRVREICQEFVEEFPADPRVLSMHMILAESLAESQLYSDSSAHYKKLLRMTPDTDRRGEIEFLIARNHYRAGNLPAAVSALERTRQKYPDTATARDSSLLLAKTLAASGRGPDAERALLGLMNDVPGSPHAAAALAMAAKIAQNTGEHERAIKYCTRWFRESPSMKHQLDVMLVLALAKLETGSPEEALAAVSDGAAFSPDSPRLAEAMVLRGRVLEALDQFEEAEESYTQAVRAAPDDTSPYANLARFYETMGRIPEAIKQMERASEVDPDDDSLLELTRLYRLNGDNVSAVAVLEAFTRNRQLSPNIGEAFFMLADTQLELDRPQDASKTLDRLLSVRTTTAKDSGIYSRQANILAGVGLHGDAVEKYRQAIKSGANAESLKPKIAGVLLADEKASECLEELASVKYRSMPAEEKFDILDMKARAFMRLGRFADARRSIRDAIALRSGRESFSTLALLMQANLALEDDRAASRISELALKLIETDESPVQAPPESRRIVLDWANRLYDKKQYARAAETYSRVSRSKFPGSDAAWALYQRGNCYYHMAQYERASETYASLADEFADSEWANFAAEKEKLIRVQAGT